MVKSKNLIISLNLTHSQDPPNENSRNLYGNIQKFIKSLNQL